ncbi:MAG TPA: stage II sporulation protein D [Candidatus Fournierella merdipullorum]|uniref:Stage II sporulation protein D n=1 Tax=Candidatus Allofournierella merdipullorum TaxID=2838595 RepID=A0A9D2IY88_9FIRM|nr:stage II sporulation protein D [Candidatus Fournierella merdipullorum]
MKRALLPIALFALLTYCLPLVSLFVPALASGDEAGASSAPESARTNQSPAAQFLAPEAEQEPEATGSADSEVIRLWDAGSQQVLEVPLLEYLIGAAASEMPVTWPDEALKAQAIASHSYALYQRDRASADKLEGAWFSADPARRQGYMTREVLQSYWGEAFEANWARLEALFTPILHQVLTYEGAPAAACYHAISNGQTEASENVWSEALSYLAGVDSTLDLTAEGYEQTVTYTTQQMYDAIVLAVPGAEPEQGKPESWFGEASYTAAGYVDEIRCAGVFIRGTDLRTALGLRSACFSIQYADGVFSVTTKGYGHGVGLSQYGASAMALTGKSCAEILAHYYPGTALETLAE